MSTAESGDGRSLYCQLYQTYFPPSYVPPSCQASAETYPQWAWALVNTVFVGAATLANTAVFLSIVFLWLVNRQFHFNKKHSYDKEPLRPLKRPTKALKKAGNKLKSAAKKISIRKKRGEVGFVAEEEAPKLAQQKKYRSFQSFLEDFEEEDEDDEKIERSLSSDIWNQERTGGDNVSPPATRAEKKRTKDLLHLASKIEVFSYLSPEAVADILEFVEYVDFKNVGDVVYDTNSLDGSLFAVVEGEVTCNLCTESNSDFTFAAGPGEVITSMLSILTSLIREHQLQDTLLFSLIPGVIGSKRGLGHGMSASSKVVIPRGMNVKAVVSRPNTRLMRIPSRCFVAIHKKFPKDVHNICATIVARLQRVTIQTLMRFLGLDAGILGISGQGLATSDGTVPEKKPRSTTPEWISFEQSLKDDPTSPSILDHATTAAASLLGLPAENSHELEGATIIHAPPGSIISSKGEPPDAIYLVLRGSTLQVGLEKGVNGVTSASCHSQNSGHRKARRARVSNSSVLEQPRSTTFKPLFSAAAGNWVGLFSCFTRDASFITVRNPEDASGDVMLLKIPAKSWENVIAKHPRALCHTLVDIIDTVGDGGSLCVSSSTYLLDMSLDWMHVEAGEYISIQGESCDSMYVVLNGRLRAESLKESNGKTSDSNREEFGRGSTIGEIETLCEGTWNRSVKAIRHCEVARIPNSVIGILMDMFPASGIHFARTIASQVHARKGLNSTSSLLPSYNLSLATVAVVPLTEAVDVSEFCSYLKRSLASIAPTKLLTKKGTKELVGPDFFETRNSMLRVKLTRILGDLEESHRLVVYESDYQYTWWCKLCVQQADCVLLLVDSREAPELKRVEELISWANEAKNLRCELVVVQSLEGQEVSLNDEHASDNLNNWSEQRPWISRQHLIRCSFEDHTQDFCRMARRITGQSIGLVLGGGGARGLAHLGIIKALDEAGIPVDLVGGTSQGAFVGALLARSPDDLAQVERNVREMASDMASVSNKLRDLTFPLTSFFSGHHFNRGIQKILGNARIQDFVLSFFCVSVDIVSSSQVVHTKGLAWKYVRASMSLTGYLPPISENNSLLVDGGYMNVVPADVMADQGAKRIIAVDVAAEDKPQYYDYGTELSGLWLLWNSWNPFVQTVKIPSMGDISERLSWVSSESTKTDIIKNKVDLFLRPPVGEFGTLEYDKIDQIVKIGYEYARPIVEEWAAENLRCEMSNRIQRKGKQS